MVERIRNLRTVANQLRCSAGRVRKEYDGRGKEVTLLRGRNVSDHPGLETRAHQWTVQRPQDRRTRCPGFQWPAGSAVSFLELLAVAGGKLRV